MKFLASLVLCLVSLGIVTICAQPAFAVLARADFNDINGASATLKAQGGGTGWTGNWGDANATGAIIVQTYGAEVTAPASTNFNVSPLMAGDPGFTGTNSIYSSTATERGISRQLAAPMTGDIWFSYAIEERSGSGIGGLFFPSQHSFLPNNKTRVQVDGSGKLTVSLGGSTMASVTNAIAFSPARNLIVGHITVGVGGDNSTVEAWSNPDVAQGAAGLAAAPHASISGQLTDGEFAAAGFSAISYAGPLGWGAANSTYMDMILISDTPTAFQDVTGRPYSPSTSADYNGNGVIDAADYVKWRKTPGSFGGDPAGYDNWRGSFGSTAGVGSISALVPEPAVSLLAICAIFAIVTATSRKRK